MMRAPITLDMGAIESSALDFKSEADTVKAEIAIKITDQASYEEACELARIVKTRWSEIEEVRKSITSPLANAQRNANAFFRPALDRYAEIEAALKVEIGRYVAERERERVEAMQALASGEDVHGSRLMARPEATGVSVRTVRKWRVVDEDAVPRQFCSPDIRKISAFLDNGGIEAIKGIEFYEEQQTSVRKVAK